MTALLTIADKIGKSLVEEIRKQIVLQGHHLTGKLEASVEYEDILTNDGVVIRFYMASYGIPLNTGVFPQRIPFGKATGAKVSKYIQGLKDFAKKRFRVTEKQALGIAFAIAKTQVKQGMPTFGSFKYSKNRERTRFVEDAIKAEQQNILKYIGELEAEITKAF